MASPLSIFRKYQYAFMVVFGVMLMIAFVIAPPILDYQRVRSEGATNTPVVSWKGGELREHDLQSLALSRNLARVFMESLLQQTLAKNGYPRVPRVLGSASEEDIVRNVLLAQRAEKMGMRVSDEAIMAYLEQLSAELLSRAEIGEVFQRALGGRMSEAQLFEILRTELLAQNYIIMLHPSLFLARGEAVTPYAAWQYHERLRRRVKAEVAPLEVASFKSQVKTEPTSAQIQALYEEGKDRYPDPERPEPGFRVPRKIAFQFVRGDASPFAQQELEAARKAVTDEEIKQHYEANKQRYTVQPTAPPSGPAAPPLPVTPQPGSETPAPPAAAPTTDSGSAAAAPAPSPPGGDASTPSSPPPASPQTPAAPDSAAPVPSEPAPAPSEPAPAPSEPAPAPSEPAPAPSESAPVPSEPAPAPSESAPSPAPPTGDPASGTPSAASEQPAPVENPPAATGSDNSGASRVTAIDTLFVRLLEEGSAESQPPGADAPADASAPSPETGAAATGETPVPAAETPAGTDAAAPVAEKPEPAAAALEGTAAAEPVAPATAVPAAPTPPETTPAPADPAAAPAAATPAVESPGASANSTVPAAPAAKPEPRPLDAQLMTEIREELAKERARKTAQTRLDKALAEVKREVDIYGREARQTEGPRPKPLDLESFASERGLTAGKTQMVDAREAQQYELGRSFEQVQFAWPPQRQEFAQVAYQDGIELYRPAQIQGENRDIYFLYWRVGQRDPYVPELAEIRDKVVDVWKQREALAIAKAEAERLADKVRKAGVSLKEGLADRTDLTAQDTNEFSWLSTGFTPAGMGAPGLSFVDNVQGVGEGFMEAVHRLKVGETGIAVNEPQDRVYLVRILSETPGIDELRKQFLEAGRSYEVQQIASMSGQQYLRQWYESIEKEMQVEWQRPPRM